MEKHLTHDMLITVAVALSTGVLLVGLSRRLNLSALVLLLLGGIALGPEGIGVVKTDTLGAGLPVLVSLAVGLILFEGGLTLDPKGYRLAPALIRRLLTVGVLITWFTTAAAIWLIFGLGFSFALLSPSFVNVTGPTVIGPMLKRVKVVPL
ncbi:cation:proton antiporter, partial [bacterium]|nr:cation:proton antiporter [bacterium]